MSDTEKFISPCPQPTPYEREILIHLAEEAMEVGQRVTKMLRFGRDEVQPGQDLDNKQRLSMEIGNFVCMIDKVLELGLAVDEFIERGIEEKERKLPKYLQCTPDSVDPETA